MVGEIQLPGVARHEGVEVGRATIGLGAQDAAEALGLLLARSEGARDLDQQVGVGQVEREVADLREHEQLLFALAEGLVQLLALFLRRLAGDQRRGQVIGNIFELLEVLADDQRLRAFVLLQDRAGQRRLRGFSLAMRYFSRGLAMA